MTKPNILLICVDHWPGRLLGAAGNDNILTPTLDQFCENGIHFTDAYTATPSCIPARRAIMTGTTARTHGDRVYSEKIKLEHEQLSLMAQEFRNSGYQAYGVGKMHVYPQRARTGFDDVIINEEGRDHLGMDRDDYEIFLSDEGYAGEGYAHAMAQNQYVMRPWHLPEKLHPTNWTTKQMCRMIQRRDPTRPSFWYCSYIAPHPPLTPPREYLDMYRDKGVDEPHYGEWAKDQESLPYSLKRQKDRKRGPKDPYNISRARMGFYAQCTYIDHQIRLLIGTMREEGVIDDTIIMFISDHGDMLGNHDFWAKGLMLEDSVRVPMILVPHADYQDEINLKDNRLVELRDVMPTLLDLCDIPIPDTVEGLSLVSDERRDHIYCEHGEGESANRMIRKGSLKLIYYPVGNRFQLFNLENDPRELNDLSDKREYKDVKEELKKILKEHLYGDDLNWIKNGKFVGLSDKELRPSPDRGLSTQRGLRW